jgi:hypothetical protein
MSADQPSAACADDAHDTFSQPPRGYERARLFIQCTPAGRPYLGVGTYLQADTGAIVSPVCADGAELYAWIRRQGWRELPTIPLTYQRRTSRTPDPLYFAQTTAALIAYADAQPSIHERWFGTTAQFKAAAADEARALQHIRYAFARDSADRNNEHQAEALTLSYTWILFTRWCRQEGLGAVYTAVQTALASQLTAEDRR